MGRSRRGQEEVTSSKDQLGGTEPGSQPQSRGKSQGRGNAVLGESGLSWEARRRRRPGGQEPCLWGQLAWRAGRTGGRAARGQGELLGRPAQLTPVASRTPDPQLLGCRDESSLPPRSQHSGRFADAHALRERMPTQSPSRCSALGPAPRSNGEAKRAPGAPGPPQPAVISTSHDQVEGIQEAKLSF